MKKELELEEVKLLTVSKKNEEFNVKLHEEYFNDYELYGFLRIYINAMEERFVYCMQDEIDENG